MEVGSKDGAHCGRSEFVAYARDAIKNCQSGRVGSIKLELKGKGVSASLQGVCVLAITLEERPIVSEDDICQVAAIQDGRAGPDLSVQREERGRKAHLSLCMFGTRDLALSCIVISLK